MENVPIYESDTVEALALAKQTDAAVFARRFTTAAQRTPPMATDYESMLSWFAVSIESGRAAGLAAALENTPQPVSAAPTGTIFQLDLFRERLQRVADDYDGALQVPVDEVHAAARELKTLIDNVQAQYCKAQPVSDDVVAAEPMHLVRALHLKAAALTDYQWSHITCTEANCRIPGPAMENSDEGESVAENFVHALIQQPPFVVIAPSAAIQSQPEEKNRD